MTEIGAYIKEDNNDISNDINENIENNNINNDIENNNINNNIENNNDINNDIENNNINNDINNNIDNNININLPNPPRKNLKNNYFYSMEKENDIINARTSKPITTKNYDFVQKLVTGNSTKQDNNTKNNLQTTQKEEEKNEQNIQQNNSNLKNNFDKKIQPYNTIPAIYIYNYILEKNIISEKIIDSNIDINNSNIISKREYSFLNDGEINELDYENAFVHDNRKFCRIYFGFLKYNLLFLFSFCVSEDFNTNAIKLLLFIDYLMIYLVFNTAFFNDRSVNNIYKNESEYKFLYHFPKILGAFVLSIIIIKLLQLFITFNRRKSLKMKLMKRYTDAKIEIINIIQIIKRNFCIYLICSIPFIIFFWYYISVICAVFRNSHECLILNWVICFFVHIIYSVIFNFIPTILRIQSFKKTNNRECMYKEYGGYASNKYPTFNQEDQPTPLFERKRNCDEGDQTKRKDGRYRPRQSHEIE